jgi:predicted phosphoribosyltransferase
MMFNDRVHAGKVLAEKIPFEFDVVGAIPRGGVLVGAEIAKKFNKPLYIVGVRKIPIPWEPEAGFGAIAEDGSIYLNEKILPHLNLSDEMINELAEDVRREVERRVKVYRKKEIDLKGKVVLLVDDGFATGYTAIAGIMMLKKKGASRVYAVAPCAPLDTVNLLKKHADDVFVLNVQKFGSFAVGSYYEDFRELSDEDVLNAMKDVDP